MSAPTNQKSFPWLTFTLVIINVLLTHNKANASNEIVISQNQRPDVVIDGTPSPDSSSNSVRFTCDYIGNQYTIMYNPETQPNQAYPWAVPGRLGGGWTSEKRCQEISRRLEFYRPDGLLEMGTAVENNYETVCVTTQKDPSCRIVLTVPPGQNGLMTRDLVFQNLLKADSGQQTQGVNTFTENSGDNQILTQISEILNNSSTPKKNKPSSNSSKYINLRPFLDPSDGGTGVQLKKK